MSKLWAIGDVHGCARTLQTLVEEKIAPARGVDTIVMLGDYIDRGPASRQVIDYLWQLTEDGYEVVCLMGNHEESMLKAYDTAFLERKNWLGQTRRVRNHAYEAWLQFGGDTTMRSFGAEEPRLLSQPHMDWMRSLPSYHLTDGYVFVHAGLNFDLDNPFDDEHAMRWTREFIVEGSKIDQRRVIHGHVPVHIDLIRECVEKGYDFVDLDNGCVYPDRPGQGQLVGLELHSGTLAVQPNVDMT